MLVCPDLDFPKYPTPKGHVIPLDADGKRVTENNQEIVNVIMPLWYYQKIVEYKVKVDEAETEYEAFKIKIKE